MNRKEIFLLVSVILFAVFITKFPALYHSLNPEQGYWFVGHAEWFDQKDVNTYISHIRTAQEEGLFIKNRYTLEEHPGAFIFQPYTFLGILNRSLELDPIFLFHIASIITASILITACYFLTKILFKDFIIRLSAFIIVVLGGGLGWLLPQVNPLDLQGAGFTLVNALERSHDALSTTFLILSVCFAILFVRKRLNRYLFLSAMFAFSQTIIHPPFIFLYVPAYLLFGLILYRKTKIKKFTINPLLLSASFGIYFLFFLRDLMKNPGYISVVNQNLWSVDPILLLIGFGLFTPFIFANILKTKTLTGILLAIFFILQLIFVLSPVGFNLYFLKGIFIWGVTLAFVYVEKTKIERKKLFGITFLLVFFSLFSRLYTFNELLRITPSSALYYLSSQDKEAFRFLNTLPDNSNILSMYIEGNSIPAQTNHKVYFGHLSVTPDGIKKISQTKRFFSEMNQVEQVSFIRLNKIEYIYYGREETIARRDLGVEYKNPFPWFQKVYSNEKTIIYKTSVN